MDTETWHPVKGHPWEGILEVSNLGRVRYCFVLPQRNRAGYRQVSVRHQGAKTTIGVHRLVAAAFIRAPEPGEVINHLNCNKADNKPENLEWTTPAGNSDHARRMGLYPRGLANRRTKIDPAVMIQMRLQGASMSSIGRHFGATTQAVSQYFTRERAAGRLPDGV